MATQEDLAQALERLKNGTLRDTKKIFAIQNAYDAARPATPVLNQPTLHGKAVKLLGILDTLTAPEADRDPAIVKPSVKPTIEAMGKMLDGLLRASQPFGFDTIDWLTARENARTLNADIKNLLGVLTALDTHAGPKPLPHYLKRGDDLKVDGGSGRLF